MERAHARRASEDEVFERHEPALRAVTPDYRERPPARAPRARRPDRPAASWWPSERPSEPRGERAAGRRSARSGYAGDFLSADIDFLESGRSTVAAPAEIPAPADLPAHTDIPADRSEPADAPGPADVPAPAVPAWALDGEPGARRTVQISGRPAADRSAAARPLRLQSERTARSAAPGRSVGSSPDRLALWAVVMCLLLALVAAATARGEDRPAAPSEPPTAIEARP